VQAELKSTRERLAALAAKEGVMRRKLDERSAYRQLARRTNAMWMRLFLYGWIWRFWWVGFLYSSCHAGFMTDPGGPAWLQ
jgi:hypothetical protein